jgi:hypothetical protein
MELYAQNDIYFWVKSAEGHDKTWPALRDSSIYFVLSTRDTAFRARPLAHILCSSFRHAHLEVEDSCPARDQKEVFSDIVLSEESEDRQNVNLLKYG